MVIDDKWKDDKVIVSFASKTFFTAYILFRWLDPQKNPQVGST